MQSSSLDAAFQAAKETALQQVEAHIEESYQDKEVLDFRFDAFAFWGSGKSLPQSIIDFFEGMKPAKERILSGVDLFLDNWYRGLLSLSKEQALELAKLVEVQNADWEYAIARRLYDGDPMDYYNPRQIMFMLATGTEHMIKAGAKGHDDAWQWT